MSIVAVHGPNTMFTSGAGVTSIPSSPVGASGVQSNTNGLVFNMTATGTRVATDYAWTASASGVCAPTTGKTTVVTFPAGAAGVPQTITCTVAGAGTPPLANGAYVTTVTPVSGAPRSLPHVAGQSVEGDEGDGGYDPGEHTVAEVQEHVNDLDTDEEIRAIYDAELRGKSRSTLVAYLESLLPFDPSGYTVEVVVDYATQNPDELDDIIAAEKAGKDRKTLLSHLEALQTT